MKKPETKLYPLAERINKVTTADFAQPISRAWQTGPRLLDLFPPILGEPMNCATFHEAQSVIRTPAELRLTMYFKPPPNCSRFDESYNFAIVFGQMEG